LIFFLALPRFLDKSFRNLFSSLSFWLISNYKTFSKFLLSCFRQHVKFTNILPSQIKKKKREGERKTNFFHIKLYRGNLIYLRMKAFQSKFTESENKIFEINCFSLSFFPILSISLSNYFPGPIFETFSEFSLHLQEL
jgi:hypothetical protein